MHLHDAIRQLRSEELGVDDTTKSEKYQEDLNRILHDEALEHGKAAWSAYLFEHEEHEAEIELFIEQGMTNLARAMLEQDKSLDNIAVDQIIIYLQEETRNESTTASSKPNNQ